MRRVMSDESRHRCCNSVESTSWDRISRLVTHPFRISIYVVISIGYRLLASSRGHGRKASIEEIHAEVLPRWRAGMEAAGLPPAHRDIFAIGAYTGMRLGEVVSLRWERIDLGRAILRVEETKTGEPLELPLTRQLAAVFERRRTEAGDRDEGWVFPSSVSVTGHLKNLHRYHAGISKAAGTRFWFQCARQTGASAAGESPAGKKGKPPLPPRVMGRHS